MGGQECLVNRVTLDLPALKVSLDSKAAVEHQARRARTVRLVAGASLDLMEMSEQLERLDCQVQKDLWEAYLSGVQEAT